MKVYTISYMTRECGCLEAFSSRAKAKKRATEIKKEFGPDSILGDIDETSFDISSKGIIEALEYGASSVYK